MHNAHTGAGGSKRAILAVSFGTCCPVGREEAIGGVERALAEAHPGWGLYRAFTSPTIRGMLLRRQGLSVDSAEEALDRLAGEGGEEVLVQPTYIIGGYEYNRLAALLEARQQGFRRLVLGAPLLAGPGDCRAVAAALLGPPAPSSGGEAVVFVGHGTGHQANRAYTDLQQAFQEAGAAHCLVGTVEAAPTQAQVLDRLRAGGWRSVVLVPLMVAAGSHARKDIAGSQPGSWQSVLAGAGYPATCALRGLGQMEPIRQIYVAHAQAALEATP